MSKGSEQLFFQFPHTFDVKKSDIIVGDFNKNLVDFLFNNHSWLSKVLLIYGSKGVGKTFISKAYVRQKQGVEITVSDLNKIEKIEHIIKDNILLLEDIQLLDYDGQIGLFNLYNSVINLGGNLLLTSALPLDQLHIFTEDLQSRLRSAMYFIISPPEENALKTIFFKMLSDKQLNVSIEIIDYILKRITRDCATLQRIVEKIEIFTMIEKKSITMGNIKDILN